MSGKPRAWRDRLLLGSVALMTVCGIGSVLIVVASGRSSRLDTIASLLVVLGLATVIVGVVIDRKRQGRRGETGK